MFTDPTRLHIDAGFYISLAIALLVIPVKWVLAWLLAAAIHEIGHFAAVHLTDHRIYSIRIGCFGAKMETDLLGRWEWLCALAGPLCSFALLGASSWWPELAACGGVQMVFNLMPISAMDGGRVLESLLRLLLGDRMAKIIVSLLSTAAVSFLAVISLKLSIGGKGGMLPLLVCIGLAAKCIKIKFPCKDGLLRVQ